MSPEEQIDWTLGMIAETRHRPVTRQREADLDALLDQLQRQWRAYTAGTLAATDPTVEI